MIAGRIVSSTSWLPSSQKEEKKAIAMAVRDEALLLERARACDPHALSDVYDLYASRIYSYLYHRVGDAGLAEDLTGQVFLRMLEAIRHERAWTTSFSGWLYRIAHNLVVDHFRRRGRNSQVGLDDAPDVPSDTRVDPVNAAEQKLDQDDLRTAITRLTEEQAQVISLRFLEEKSIAEVAEIIGKSEGAVKALQYRAVIALRRIMDGES